MPRSCTADLFGEDDVVIIGDDIETRKEPPSKRQKREDIVVTPATPEANETEPDDDDIIVTLDLDGDTFAHPDVLAHLLDYYADDTLLTYGNYEPVPPDPGCPPVLAYPEGVVAARSYRAFREVRFNHLRTMKGRVFKAIPVEQFQFASGPKRGQWYTKGNDVEFTFCGLELVGRRFKVIDEVLLHYNSINPNSNWRIAPRETDECIADFFNRPPLEELP